MFFKETASVREEKESWPWLKDGYRDLKKETEGLILAAQEQAIRTNWIKKMIDMHARYFTKVQNVQRCRRNSQPHRGRMQT